ncbi:nucleolin 1-like [Brassica napus]|uniref:nucleolin 1-like n=1 Tax=Brassica oleracea var. oleracea TaxID=109376 RepID=UPI0006A74DC3|nr:PREDICTED: nucleolin 1-like [Brassica oleracea var. oleracea]XP_022557799.1 nucleolin 1-like [Brassica napus]
MTLPSQSRSIQAAPNSLLTLLNPSNLSCGEVFRVIVPTDFIVDRRAFVILLGHGAEEKALQLNGSDIGDWNALVKVAPEEEEEEYQMHATNYCSLFGIAVLGYDTSLPEDEIESKLTANFSSCGKITHVFVCPLDECTNIYFSKEEGEASALDLNGSEVGGFKITTMRVATVRSNPPLAPGETRIGYSIPAHFIEFARENEEKLNDYMTK